MKKNIFIIILMFSILNINSEIQKTNLRATETKNYETIINNFYDEMEFNFQVDSAVKLAFSLGLFFAKKYMDSEDFDKIKQAVLNKLGSSDETHKIIKAIEFESSLDNLFRGIGNILLADKILELLKEKNITKETYTIETLSNVKTFLKELDASDLQIETAQSEIKNVLNTLKEPAEPIADPAIESTTDKILDALPKIFETAPALIMQIIILYQLAKGRITGAQAATATLINQAPGANVETTAMALGGMVATTTGDEELGRQITETGKDLSVASSAGKKLISKDKNIQNEGVIETMNRVAEKRSEKNRVIEHNDQALPESAETAIAFDTNDQAGIDNGLAKLSLSSEERSKLEAAFKASTLPKEIITLKTKIQNQIALEKINPEPETLGRFNTLLSKVEDLAKLKESSLTDLETIKKQLESYTKEFANIQTFSLYQDKLKNFQNRLDLIQKIKIAGQKTPDPRLVQQLKDLNTKVADLKEDIKKATLDQKSTKEEIDRRVEDLTREIERIEHIK